MLAGLASAEVLRLATFNTGLARKGPGLLLRDVLKQSQDTEAIAQTIASARADVIALQDVDYDHGLRTLQAIRDRITAAGWDYPYVFALRPNTGWQTGLDLDGDGRRGRGRDAQGYGRFAGQGGMALLSRWPIEKAEVANLSEILWADAPNAEGPHRPDVLPAHLHHVQRLSTVGHWSVPITTRWGRLRILMFHATPPVFDGPEDRNGYRNADELRLMTAYLNGDFGDSGGSFVILADANNDPWLGEGHKPALLGLLRHPRVQDPSTGKAGTTVQWPDMPPMRVDYALPSLDLQIHETGVVATYASRHDLVWVDVAPP